MSWNILGHAWAASMLQEHLVHGRLRHAYLFTGPPGVGRRTLALRFAQAINCLSPQAPGEPCGACRNCLQIDRMQHPDLTVIQSEPPGGTLKVDQVRSLQHTLALSPYEASYRIALLLRFEEAHPSAANALLKTLEEPPPQVILLLTATDNEGLLPTITSRCELIPLHVLPVEELARDITSFWGAAEEQGEVLAHLSGGRPGIAHKMFHEPERLALRMTRLEEMERLLGSNRIERFRYVETLSKDKQALVETLQTWLSYWRDVFLRASGAQVSLTNLDREREIILLAEAAGAHTAYLVVSNLERTLRLVDRNVNPRLAIEILMLDLPHR